MGKETLIVENVGIKFNLSEEKVDEDVYKRQISQII